MALQPHKSPVVDSTGRVTPRWWEFFATVSSYINAFTESGPTTGRPTRFLWKGRRYWDETLDRPVYVKSIKPIVWVTGDGVDA
jgi:hypothetical protein